MYEAWTNILVHPDIFTISEGKREKGRQRQKHRERDREREVEKESSNFYSLPEVAFSLLSTSHKSPITPSLKLASVSNIDDCCFVLSCFHNCTNLITSLELNSLCSSISISIKILKSFLSWYKHFSI